MRRLVRRVRNRLQRLRPRPLILMYHRVAAPAHDPWGLAVHPDRFSAHMEVVRRRRTPLPMAEFVERLQNGRLPDNAVAVTFDDGYVDNLIEARPRLEAVAVPATIFLVAGALGRRREFWWDEVARAILGRRESLEAEISVNGKACHLALSDMSDVDEHENASWRAWQEPRTDHQRTFLDVWSLLRSASADNRGEAMDRLRDVMHLPTPDPADLPMTPGDVAQVSRDGLVEIGGHTVTHPVLTLLDGDDRRREIAEGKRQCEDLIGREVAGFAYPHGALDADCRAAVRDSGFSWACTTVCTPVPQPCDPHALPRLFVQDWDADTFEAALR